MPDKAPTTAAIADSISTFEPFSNKQLNALSLALHIWNAIPLENIAFTLAVDARLINESGEAFDLDALRAACNTEVDRRIQARESSQ